MLKVDYMKDRKKGILQLSIIVSMIILFVAAFVSFFKGLGQYTVGIVLFGIFIFIIDFIGNGTRINNEEHVYSNSYRNNDNW